MNIIIELILAILMALVTHKIIYFFMERIVRYRAQKDYTYMTLSIIGMAIYIILLLMWLYNSLGQISVKLIIINP